MRKVLFVLSSLDVGGTVSSLASIIEYLKQEYKIDVLALSHDGISNISFKDRILKRNIFFHSYYCRLSQSHGLERIIIILIKVLFKICTKFGINVERLFCKLNWSIFKDYDTVVGFQEGVATRFVSYTQNRHKLAWVHCDYENFPMAGTELHIYEKFTTIICVSQYTSSTFIRIYPSLCDKVKSIHNLMNIAHITKMSQHPICDNQFDNSIFTIISVGRIDKVKRFELIPEIAFYLKHKGCQFRWYIIGPSVCQLTYNKLLSNIKNFNVEKNVFCIGNRTNPYPYFLKSSLLVSLSYTEACPMIFNEAKILNLPIVTSDFGSSYEFIEDGKYGIIAPLKKIAKVIENLISDRSVYDVMKTKMYAVEYSNDNILVDLRTVLSNL